MADYSVEYFEPWRESIAASDYESPLLRLHEQLKFATDQNRKAAIGTVIRRIEKLQFEDTENLRHRLVSLCKDDLHGTTELFQLMKELESDLPRLKKFSASDDFRPFLLEFPGCTLNNFSNLLLQMAEHPIGCETILNLLDDFTVPPGMASYPQVFAELLVQNPSVSNLSNKIQAFNKLLVFKDKDLTRVKNSFQALICILESKLAKMYLQEALTSSILEDLLTVHVAAETPSEQRVSAADSTMTSMSLFKIFEHSAEVPQLRDSTKRSLMSLIACQTEENRVFACTAVNGLFTINALIARDLFNDVLYTPRMLNGLLESAKTRSALLAVMSAACLMKECREKIAAHGLPFLEACLKNVGEWQAFVLATLVLCKLGKVNYEVEHNIRSALIITLMQNLMRTDTMAATLEIFMLLSTQDDLKNCFLDQKLFTTVSGLRGTTFQQAAYPILVTLDNMTRLPDSVSEAEKQMRSLVLKSKEAEIGRSIKIESADEVLTRIGALHELQALSIISRAIQATSSHTRILLCQLIKSFATVPATRSKLGIIGAVRFLISVAAVPNDENFSIAAHGLAKILISVDPTLTFNSGTTPAVNAVAILLLFLELDDQGELECFETLLALTNLSSMGEYECSRIVSSWPSIQTTLFSSNVMIQRAGMELVCNLCASQAGTLLFTRQKDKNLQNLQIVTALLESEDFQTRRAAFGAIASLVDQDDICEAVCAKTHTMSVLLDALEDEQPDIVHRALVISLTMSRSAAVMQYLRQTRSLKAIHRGASKARSPQLLDLFQDLIKVVKAR